MIENSFVSETDTHKAFILLWDISYIFYSRDVCLVCIRIKSYYFQLLRSFL